MSNKKTKPNNSTPTNQTDTETRSKQLLTEGALIGCIALCLIMMVALLSYSPEDPGWSKTATTHQVENAIGPAGALFADIFFNLFGAMAFLFPLLLAARALQILRTCLLKEALPFDSVTFSLRLIGFVLVMVSATSLANIQFDTLTIYPSGFGGVLGKTISESVLEVFSFTGATVILLSLFFFGLTVFAEISWIALIDSLGVTSMAFAAWLTATFSEIRRKQIEKNIAKEAKVERSLKVEAATKMKKQRKPVTISAPEVKAKNSKRVEREKQQPLFIDEKLVGVLPPLNLLDSQDKTTEKGFSDQSLEHLSLIHI